MRTKEYIVTAFALSSPILGVITVLCTAPALRSGAAPRRPDPPALIAQGKSVYASLDCNTCHTISNTGTQVGPDLTFVGKTWTAARLKTMIRHPTKIAPKGYMPAYANTKISKTQLAALTAYLASLK